MNEKISIVDDDLVKTYISEFRDKCTGEHIQGVSSYSALIAKGLGLSEKEIVNIQWASTMHDIGKIAIPDNILLKPGKLNAREWKLMQQHTTIGAQLLSGYKNALVNLSAVIALTHHEKWDGSGYPQGLKGENIPLAGRIVALADVFDALLSVRPYKKPSTVEEALLIIRQNSESHFDPQIVEAFLARTEEVHAIFNSKRAGFREKNTLASIS